MSRQPEPSSVARLVVLWILVATGPARALDMGVYLQNAAFRGIITAIARVNNSMRSAALNPQDEFRREAVREAVRALPAAIIALAEEYRAVKLDPREFPAVQAMLGGFVDVNAAKIYDQFLLSPDQRAIPKTGTDFPKEYLQPARPAPRPAGGDSARIGFDDGADPGGYRLDPKPKFWRCVPWRLVARASWEPGAHAEGAEALMAIADIIKAKGEAVAQVLMGLAAVIAAVAPMVVAGIQASADKKIAKINAETQIKMTEITAGTSKYLADQQKDIALRQSNVARQVAQQNNKGVTDRLQMQLVELRDARDDAQRAERERREMDARYNEQRIALAEKQAGDNLKLAKASLNAQLTQAGLSQGFANSTNSGDRLGVSRSGVASRGTTDLSVGGQGAAAGGASASALPGETERGSTRAALSAEVAQSERAVADEAGASAIAVSAIALAPAARLVAALHPWSIDAVRATPAVDEEEAGEDQRLAARGNVRRGTKRDRRDLRNARPAARRQPELR